MELIIVRHGQSVADIEKRMEGRADFPLTELGVEQAEKVSEWIAKKYVPNYIFTSPLSRTIETSEIISRKVGVDVTIDDDLIDWNHGVLAGMLRSEASVKYPEKPEGRKPHEAIEGGESPLELRYRAENFISKIVNDPKYVGKKIIVVTHGMVINNLFAAFMGVPISTNIRFPSVDTGVHSWMYHNNYKYVLFTNSTEHLK